MSPRLRVAIADGGVAVPSPERRVDLGFSAIVPAVSSNLDLNRDIPIDELPCTSKGAEPVFDIGIPKC